MSLTTDNGKLAVMEWDNVYEPALPLSPGSFGQDDQQQLIWGIPEVLWASTGGGGLFDLVGSGGLAGYGSIIVGPGGLAG